MIPSPGPRLLAPAGCFASLQAALDAGADEIYFGVEQFNMRARARRHFKKSDLPEIIRRCREKNVKSCLALNTLIYDHDLKGIGNILDTAQEEGLNAVIAADMSVVQAAGERNLEVHLSTQLSISNFDSLKFYAPFADRVVLARELSLPMIRALTDRIKKEDLRGRSGRLMEIEVFAHGALCIALSGRCHMSLYQDNASANRGACLQNCRREYEVIDRDSGKSLVLDNHFVMSPEDILTLDFLDEIVNSGVKVLKLEGRARSPEYVFTVTRIYRQALEAIASDCFSKTFVEAALEELKKVYNRGFSSGYYLGRPQGWSGSYGSKANRQKIEIGEITNYYSRLKVAEIQARSGSFSLGDEYLIIGNSSGVLQGKARELRVDDRPVASLEAGTLFSMPVPKRVRRKDRLYLLKKI
jgi:putative protease